MTVVRKRGRPRKSFFADGSPAIPSRPLSELAQALVIGGTKFEAEIRRDYGVGPHVPLDLVWPLLALDDDNGLPTQSDAEAIRAYRAGKAKQQETARLASDGRTKIRDDRRARVQNKNAGLLKKIEQGTLTRNSAVTRIREQWDRKGDDGEMPSARTLNDWLS